MILRRGNHLQMSVEGMSESAGNDFLFRVTTLLESTAKS
jgi:hypothetical protein